MELAHGIFTARTQKFTTEPGWTQHETNTEPTRNLLTQNKQTSTEPAGLHGTNTEPTRNLLSWMRLVRRHVTDLASLGIFTLLSLA